MTLDIDQSFLTEPTPEADAGWTPQLEKDYCTNYTCCGLMLADLHELVGHFEEQHVTVVSPTGVPLWCGSPSSAGFSGSSSSCSASPTSPNPHPFPTLTSAFTPVMTSGSRDPGAYLAQNCLAQEEEHVFDTMLHSEVYEHAPASVVPQHTMSYENANASASTSYDNGNYDNTSYDKLGYTSYDMTAETAASAASATTDDVPASSPTHVHLPTIAPTPVHARPQTLSIITDTEPERTSCGERRKKGRRERVHKCPHEGCVKTYLNLNGLKYHLTKGACVFS